MILDQELLDRLAALPQQTFAGNVYRATRIDADPAAPSFNGGRWSVAPINERGVSALYTSLEREGAIAEVAAFLCALTPVPKRGRIKVSTLRITASRVVTLDWEDLEKLGVERHSYGARDYARTQEIGSALAWLGCDGLLAPSARWDCQNLTLFCDNHNLSEQLEPVAAEELEWRPWASRNGLLPAGEGP